MNDNESTVTPLRPDKTGLRDAREEFLMDAAACRGRAIADLQEASTMPTAKARRLFESSAATWGARAALFKRREGGSERQFAEADPLTKE